ncbi:DUF2235 domain-containing protein [Chryseobacterium indologenes]|uniref:phospholipase effector Tle1 domain-containing protein n=1 Tax=Chryseobacterium TaxID=59732 RepID=UPI000488975B|nr:MULTISPECIES: DUF2235 domain-containing protein [Chryseobacterium]ASE62318.1 DUF2235 domain-containing protein [Chryseobacterium indologenes]ATN06151.1 hypothetical protein CRN76_12445 [Chryseobacterium indologenes]AYY85089.1 DUF2235 domain-containing protein [Chryseobacterium indologenes]AYZ34760.1 DUF2235 domain-containing protein [Chryseobacterium indologenes]MBF6643346.1 DUF2235 domain-containing protein [Chryseobacterium indologenes]
MSNVVFGNYTPENIEDDSIDAVLGVFFDGTLNNKANTKERENNTEVYKKYGIKTWSKKLISEKKDTSYDNGWSNVARMSEACNADYGIYIEGIGTDDRKDDENSGFAFGSGDTGIRGKVRKGCEETVKRLKEKLGNKKKVAVLTLDVFGFSRGAAAARNFVYEINKRKYAANKKTYTKRKVSVTFYSDDDGKEVPITQLPPRGHLGLKLMEAGITVERIVVRFLGIYDTVSSYHPGVSAKPNFSNDVEELHLDDITSAKKIVHFIATDEHRENFDLTNVAYDTDAKGKKQVPVFYGEEKTFPGVHSDIGGSYLSETEWVREIETDWTDKRDLKPLEDRLVAEGWYNRNQLSYIGGNAYFALKGVRDLLHTYSYIPLTFMTEKANTAKCEQISMTKIKKTYDFSKDTLLVRVEKKLRGYVFKNGKPYDFKWVADLDKKYNHNKTHPDYIRELAEQKDLRDLRNKYLHWSADRYAIGMDPRSDRKRVVH